MAPPPEAARKSASQAPDKLGELLVRTGTDQPGAASGGARHPEGPGRPARHQPDQAGPSDREPARRRSLRAVQRLFRRSQQVEIDDAVIKLIPADVARKYNIFPVNKTGATITIAMVDPTNVFAMDDIKFMTGYNVEPVVASETAHPGRHRQVLRHDPCDRAEEGHGGPLRRGGQRPRSPRRGGRARPRHARGGVRRGAGRQARQPRSSPTPSSAAPPTSTSSPTRRTTASATASTASSTRSCSRR